MLTAFSGLIVLQLEFKIKKKKKSSAGEQDLVNGAVGTE